MSARPPAPIARAALAASGLGLTSAAAIEHRMPAAAGLGAVLLALAGADGWVSRRARRRAAAVDPVTGRASLAALHAHLAGAGTTGVVVVRLDGLDGVRAADGDDAADAILREAAARVVEAIPGAVVARADHAALAVACELADGADADALAELLRDALHRPFGPPTTEVGFVARCGAALPAEPGTLDPPTLVRRAAAAAWRAHDTGATFELDDAAIGPPSSAGADAALVADLRRALDGDELCFVYLPVVHLATATAVTMEALVRWRHPLRGELQPTAFVDAAERHGLGQALTRWALDAAVGQVAAWCADGTYLPVSVNVSARRVSDPTFADDVEDALARHDVPPHLLEIELTETASPPDLGAARIVLQRLHRLGIGIAIDGFGTGHASLAYLEALPVDVVKIDGSFVARLARRPGDDAIVRTILALGHSLGLQVVAEGVHDDRVARRLAELGCELGQGFRWTRPLPPSDALAWARASAASARRWHDVGGTAA